MHVLLRKKVSLSPSVTLHLDKPIRIREGLTEIWDGTAVEELATVQDDAHGAEDGKVEGHDHGHVPQSRQGGDHGRQDGLGSHCWMGLR